ncbi:hypothetical protein C4D60_Mb07t01750 [Musa balbisiana]|uniref:Inositol polyphosphate-related phosphatase domain-containing protein n=1 Tax=Musa balbisiana TaxID=52838 RepID=A0A4S8JC97_MUSBA|nr:hypothetical protein C4D60_Mb07t01750 [Musa balbisiana]
MKRPMEGGESCARALSWSKSLVRRWFNIKSKAQDFHSDNVFGQGADDEWSTFPVRETCKVGKSKAERLYKESTDQAHRGKFVLDAAEVTETLEYRIFVATWNVGGKSPPSNLNLEDWLHVSPLADIYVLGFQEIVPLNAGNVLGTEDNGPAKKWVSLIRKALNNLLDASSNGGYQTHSLVSNPVVEQNDHIECSSTGQRNSSFFHRHSFQSWGLSMRMDEDIMAPQVTLDHRYSVCDQVIFGSRQSDYDPSYRLNGFYDDEYMNGDSPGAVVFSPTSHGHAASSTEERDGSTGHSRYCLLASKQMVGIFLTVWVKRDIRDSIRNLKVSCVGRGLMGYLGNKGSISVSLSFHQTSFCFICSHLTSGQKEGDELRRNSDVMEILRKTRFPPVHGDEKSPETILEHDRIIWLGDLNYRIALSHRSAKALVEMRNWNALLEKDQLQLEQRCGGVFEGWNEGRIYFPPTYKYSNNSDQYSGDVMNQKEKCRTPAWCDRILWYGRGLNQLSYFRGESRFSDHRPAQKIYDPILNLLQCMLFPKPGQST